MSRKRGNASYLEDLRYHLNSALLLATKNGDITTMKHILDAGADVNTRDTRGFTPLHWACDEGHTDLTRLLLERGADVDVVNYYNANPIDWAMRFSVSRSKCEQLLDFFREHYPELTLESVLQLDSDDPLRENMLDWYREHHPEMVMEAYCSRDKSPQP